MAALHLVVGLVEGGGAVEQEGHLAAQVAPRYEQTAVDEQACAALPSEVVGGGGRCVASIAPGLGGVRVPRDEPECQHHPADQDHGTDDRDGRGARGEPAVLPVEPVDATAYPGTREPRENPATMTMVVVVERFSTDTARAGGEGGSRAGCRLKTPCPIEGA